MVKTAQEWRREWRKAKYNWLSWCDFVALWGTNHPNAKQWRQEMSNCVLGYARARGWFNV